MAYKRVLRSLVGSEKAGATASATEYTVVLEIYDTLNDPEALSPKKLLDELAGVNDPPNPPDPAILFVSLTYSGFGSDDPDPTAFFKNVDIGDLECDDDNIFFRTATIKYDSERAAGNEAPTGQTDPNPLNWDPWIIINEVSRTLGAESMIFMGAFKSVTSLCLPCEAIVPTLVAIDNSAVAMAKDTCQPIQNTAGTPMQNPPEVERIDDEITIIKTKAAVVEADTENCFKGTINNADLLIDMSTTQLFKQLFKKHTLKLTGVKKELKQRRWRHAGGETTQLYWEKRYVLLYRPQGWYHDLANVGKMRAAGVGDDDGFGGAVSGADIQPGVPLQKPIKRDGDTLDEVSLDLCGQPSGSPGGLLCADDALPVYMRYRPPESNFLDANLGLSPFV